MRHPAPSSCRSAGTVLLLTNTITVPANSNDTGTNAIAALIKETEFRCGAQRISGLTREMKREPSCSGEQQRISVGGGLFVRLLFAPSASLLPRSSDCAASLVGCSLSQVIRHARSSEPERSGYVPFTTS